MTNSPLDDLLSQPTISQPRPHSSGRRESRAALLSRGITLRVRPATIADQLKMSRGEFVESLPIRRAVPKLSKAEKKAAKRERKKNYS